MKDLSDKALFALVQDHDERAFAVLLERHSGLVYDLVYKRTRDDDDTKDILQDIFISLWNNREKIRIEESIYPYLHRSAKYAVIDLAIKNQRVTAYQSLLAKQDEPFCHPAETGLIASELQQQYEQEVARMPGTMQQIFRLSRDQQLSAREIALQLQISEQTVRNNITLALKKLRLSLGSDQLIVLLPLSLYISSALAVN
ncbi:RNA polymerase sigma factor [Mucilaginibacter paludis]|uniref:RNA polymerase, sigma-24 subunit, ECF subfamily n=1 Tax=Mucilaginibacter paludis DSM 18603 TaxID=714943 RepID=H1Y949_9SPHI|nr:sigma-70 family RNA polymerase sigma factor [Mucilaginibacter paludis]EHQ29087.1 RNA polymerase, sigma-24 subunit, ECF subfamily [Mucilaginibacter paludis DSM 18603]